MFKLEDVLQFQEGEDLLLLTKRHPFAVFFPLKLALLMIVAPFFFIFPLFRTGPVGVIFFVILMGVGIFLAIRTFTTWDGTVLVITNIRVLFVDQKGIFHRTVTEISGGNIWDAKWEQKGVLEKMLKFGTVYIAASNSIDATYMPHPQEVHKVVNELIFRNSGSGIQGNAATATTLVEPKSGALERLKSKLEHMDDHELERVEKKLKSDEQDMTIKRLYAEDEEITEHTPPEGFHKISPKSHESSS